MLTHLVLFKLNDPTPENVQELVARLRGLQGKIPSLRALEAGADLVRSPRSYDVGLIARFDDLDGLRAYQAHPEHEAVLAYIRQVVSNSVAVDYES